MLFSQDLARELFSRIIPYFQKEDLNVVPIGFGRNGLWYPVRLNECIKVVKYAENGKIIPHQDGPWVPFEDQASVYTMIVYLNDDFFGGETCFHNSADVGRRQIAYNKDKVKPVKGKALIFDHRLVHSSSTIAGHGSCKYILRAEIIFQKSYNSLMCTTPSGLLRSEMNNPYGYLESPTYQKARQLYEESRQAEMSGDKEMFVSKYQEVLTIQCSASSFESTESSQAINISYSLCWILSLTWLDICDMASIMRTSKAFCELCRSWEIWQQITLRRYPLKGSTPQPLPTYSIDWYTILKNRIHHTRSLSSLVVYLGVDYIRYASREVLSSTDDIRQLRRRIDDMVLEEKISFLEPEDNHLYTVGMIPSACSDFYNSEVMAYSCPMHMNIPDFLRFSPIPIDKYMSSRQYSNTVTSKTVDDRTANNFISNGSSSQTRNWLPLVNATGDAVNWPVCAAIVRMFTGLQPRQSVLLILSPYEFELNSQNLKSDESSPSSKELQHDHDGVKKLTGEEVSYSYHNTEPIFAFQYVLCAPAVRIEHLGVALLANYGYSEGVVIFANINEIYQEEGGGEKLSVTVTLPFISGIKNQKVVRNQSLDCVTYVTGCKIEEISLAAVGVCREWIDGDVWASNRSECSLPILVHVLSREKSRESIMESTRYLNDAIGGALASIKCGLIRQVVHINDSNGDVDILRGGVFLSTMNDHRSKCVFQPFA